MSVEWEDAVTRFRPEDPVEHAKNCPYISSDNFYETCDPGCGLRPALPLRPDGLGWELVSVVQGQHNSMMYAYWKRRKEETCRG